MPKLQRPTCTATRGERIARGVVAGVVASFALSMAATEPFVAILAGAAALLIGTMAITGSCPQDWFRAPAASADQPSAAEFEDARDLVDLRPTRRNPDRDR